MKSGAVNGATAQFLSLMDRFHKWLEIRSMKEFIKDLMWKLKDAGLRPKIKYTARTGTVYICFKDERLGTLRVSDHKGRRRCYVHKWNLRRDLETYHMTKHKGRTRYTYPVKGIDSMIKKMKGFKT